MAVTENAMGEQISTGIPNVRFHEILFMYMCNNTNKCTYVHLNSL